MIRTLLTAALLVACAKAPVPLAPVEPATPAPEAVPVKRTPPVSNVYFAFDVDTLKIGQIRQVSRVLSWSEHQTSIHVTGYADTVGSEAYNYALSTRRACAVAALIPKATCTGAGETAQWGADENNRRAVIQGE